MSKRKAGWALPYRGKIKKFVFYCCHRTKIETGSRWDFSSLWTETEPSLFKRSRVFEPFPNHTGMASRPFCFRRLYIRKGRHGGKVGREVTLGRDLLECSAFLSHFQIRGWLGLAVGPWRLEAVGLCPPLVSRRPKWGQWAERVKWKESTLWDLARQTLLGLPMEMQTPQQVAKHALSWEDLIAGGHQRTPGSAPVETTTAYLSATLSQIARNKKRGGALVSFLLCRCSSMIQVKVLSRSKALGYTGDGSLQPRLRWTF